LAFEMARSCVALLVLALAESPTTGLTTTPPPVRSAEKRVNRLVSDARDVEALLGALAVMEPSSRLALTGAFQKLAMRCVGSGARDARRALLGDPRFARGLEMLAAPSSDSAWRAERVEGLRFAAALTTQDDAVVETTALTADALRVAADELDDDTTPPARATALLWAAERCALTTCLDDLLEALRRRERALELPFRVRPGLASSPLAGLDASSLAQSLPFVAEEVVTRSGARVRERRHTAWVAAPDVGAMAYSGKLMQPRPLPSLVADLADHLAEELPTSPKYDCALLNLYPDGGAACKYHSDPEHGTHWHRDQCVVSAGEPRRFAFRRLDDAQNDGHRHVFYLFHGDVVHMTGDCQDQWQHAVFKADDAVTNVGPRVSFVMKHALLQPNGQKGHGDRKQQQQQRKKTTNGGKKTTRAGGSASPPPAKSKRRRRKSSFSSAAGVVEPSSSSSLRRRRRR